MQKTNPYVIIPYSKECSISKFKFSMTINALNPYVEPGLKLRGHSKVVAYYQALLELLYVSWFRFNEIFDINKRITYVFYICIYKRVFIIKPLYKKQNTRDIVKCLNSASPQFFHLLYPPKVTNIVNSIFVIHFLKNFFPP